jgi:phosphate transport system substrate-binding protein
MSMLYASPVNAADLSVVGTGDGIELLRALGAAYGAEHPQVSIVIPPSIGSGGGIAAVGSDKEVLARVARPLTNSELALGFTETPVFRLPCAFYVHRSVGISGLTARQIADIYTGRITNWHELGGPDLRIKVVRREEADSTLLVLRQSMPGWKDLALSEKSKLAVTTQEAVDSVRSVPGAIGFGPYTKALELELGVLKVDGVYPTDPSYPSAVTVSLVYKDATLTPDARDFVQYMRGTKARALLTSLGGVPVVE